MPREQRRRIAEPEALAALAHPVRLELITHLMSAGPATASACARAVGDTPSNCSYHLRVLAKLGLVAEVESEDGRERPWRALITGFDTGPADPAAPRTRELADLQAVVLQRDQRLVRDHLAGRDRWPGSWRAAEVYETYTLRLAPDELSELGRRLDALVRPYISATREDAPPDSALVHLGIQGLPMAAP